MRTGPLALRLARRELRTGLKGFRIFLACLALGVAAIAAVGSVSSAMMSGLEGDARRILGGDVALRIVHRPAEPDALSYLRESGEVSTVVSMRAMARSDAGGDNSLVELKAVDNLYPLVGTLTLDRDVPLELALQQRDGVYGAVADASLAERLNIAVGDRLRLGEATLELRALITSEPDRLVNFASFGPRLMISDAAVTETGLVQVGSMVRHYYRIVLPTSTDRKAWLADLEERFPDAGWRVSSLENATPGYDNFVSRVTLFLTLVGMTALLVGGVGVAMAVRSYLDGKTETVATLKCLGAPSRLVFQTYLLVVCILAAVGTAIGLAVGALGPLAVATLAAPLLPFHVPVAFYPMPLALAAVFGMLTAVAFSLWSLGRACDVKAAQLFRSAISPLGGRPRLPYLIGLAATVGALVVLAIATATDPWLATWFILGSVGAIALFLAASWIIMTGARKAGRPRDPELRMALANLYRPGAPTPGVVLALGLGLTVLVTIALIQANLSRQVEERLPEVAPAYFFIDIQPHQEAQFLEILHGIDGVGEVQTTPMVRGRITQINGVPADEVKIDPDVSWVLRGDRGLTYSATPPENSEVVEGTWWPADYAGPPLVSFDVNLAKGLGIGIGDSITLNILGRPITVQVGNLRKIDWGSLGMNFTFVFAPGTLEAAPHSVIATVHVDDPALEAEVQRAVTDALPNVTAIRVKDALEGANRILSAVSIAVRATAAVTLVAGTLVLAGAIAAGHARRVRNAVILKVLGATRWRIVKTYLLEYGLLGLATAAIASLVGALAAAAVVVEVMRGDFILPPGVLALTALLAMGITVSFGFVGTWRALGQRPAPMLRNE